MSKVRLRRLQADQARMLQAFSEHAHIRVLRAQGDPPDRYQIEYRLQSLTLNGEQVVKRDRHVAEIYLTTGYPRQPPQCRMLTPLFHPNVDPSAICVGDHWAAGESLAGLVVRIGEIIAYQSYNTKSPLNGEAARWCDEHRHLLPVDRSDLRPESVAQAESARIDAVAAAPPPAAGPVVPKGRLITDGGPARADADRGPAHEPQRPPRARLIAATPSRPAAAPPPEGLVTCACGRRYRTRRPQAFRCLGCGTRLVPPGAE